MYATVLSEVITGLNMLTLKSSFTQKLAQKPNAYK